MKVLTHDTVIHAFREDELSQTLPLNELVHFVFWRALSSIEYATAVCEDLQLLGHPNEQTGKRKRCPDNVTSMFAATEELHAEVSLSNRFVLSVRTCFFSLCFFSLVNMSQYESISPSWIEEEGLTATDDNKSLTSMGLALTIDG